MMPTSPHRTPVICAVYRSTLFQVVSDGIEIKCKSCRGTIHHISRARLESLWAELAQLPECGILSEEQDILHKP